MIVAARVAATIPTPIYIDGRPQVARAKPAAIRTEPGTPVA